MMDIMFYNTKLSDNLCTMHIIPAQFLQLCGFTYLTAWLIPEAIKDFFNLLGKKLGLDLKFKVKHIIQPWK